MSDNYSLYENSKVWDEDLYPSQYNVFRAILDFWPSNVSSVLDVGCGDGKFTKLLIDELKDVNFMGYDVSREALSRTNFPYTVGSATNIKFPDDSFDLTMTVDMLEHLNDEDEAKTWAELFRVSKEWVFVVVPFEEVLEEATAKCENCGELYHVNWHMRSYDLDKLRNKTPEGWNFCGAVLTGDSWSSYCKEEILFRRYELNQWNGWEKSFCQHCGASGNVAPPIIPLDKCDVKKINKRIQANGCGLRSHNEVLAIYYKSSKYINIRISYNKTNLAKLYPDRISLVGQEIKSNLLPFPRSVNYVKQSDGKGYIIQIPCHQTIKNARLKIETINNIPLLGTLTVEDINGVVPCEYVRRENCIKLLRPIEGGYYGLLVRLPSRHKITNLHLLNGKQNYFYKSTNDISYKNLNNGVKIQMVKNNLYFISETKSNYKITMICHDQSIDRRIIAQAKSLEKLGLSVTIFCLSFSSEDREELINDRIVVKRIGLKNIVPNNWIYNTYIKCYQKIGDMKVTPIFSRLLHNLNWNVYKLVLFVYYKNRNLHDPLPFKSAIINAAKNEKSHLIQVHDLPSLSAGVFLAKEQDIPLVYDAHELYPEQKAFSKVQKSICHQAEARDIKHAELVFTVNESIANEMCKRYDIPLPKVILNALDYDEDCFDDDSKYIIHRQLNIEKNTRILLFQGGLSFHRNLEELVRAFKYVKAENVCLVILGSGGMEDKLKQIVTKDNNLINKVFFIPAVPQDQLLKYTKSASVGIIPYPHIDLNSFYCTPNKLFEFIQAELPILANNSPELNRFIRDTGFGYTADMHNPKQIAKAVDHMFCTIDLERCKKNLKRDKNLYSWDVEGYKYVQYMLDVLGKFYSNSSVLKKEKVS